jgi:hypothetical protein
MEMTKYVTKKNDNEVFRADYSIFYQVWVISYNTSGGELLTSAKFLEKYTDVCKGETSNIPNMPNPALINWNIVPLRIFNDE